MERFDPQKLRAYRLARKITLKEAARAAGYKSASAILYAERGMFRLPVERAKALAKLYGVTVDDFFSDKEVIS